MMDMQDLDDGSIVVAIVRIVYSLGLILTSPLQLFPAVKVRENTPDFMLLFSHVVYKLEKHTGKRYSSKKMMQDIGMRYGVIESKEKEKNSPSCL